VKPFTSTISLDEARRRLAAAVRPIDRTERVPLCEAAGRVVAADVVASIDVPPFARAAMDGYAVIAADTRGASSDAPATLEIVERLYAGSASQRSISTGLCAEIATGAPIPDGADAVVMVEETRSADDRHVSMLAPVAAGQNVGQRAADIRAGTRVAAGGDLLTPARVGAIAAVGVAFVDVYARPRVAILSTGNEVIAPGQPLGPGQIYDVNRFTLTAVVEAHGGRADLRPPCGDSLEALAGALDACTGSDLVVFSGGSSVGERDLVAEAVAQRGEMIFHGIAVRPGKPTAFARVNGIPFLGMPGNPTSCLSNAYILLAPYLRATARLPPLAPRTVRAPLARPIAPAAGRHQFYTVRLEGGRAWPAFKGSGDITSMSLADGYIEIEEGGRREEGQVVDVVMW
jgi:molybdopterin molybdotransferase